MLTRICLGDPDTVVTLEATARAIDSLAERKLIAMVEPFLSVRENGRVRNDLSTDAVIKSIAIAEGLGSTSAYTWMKLPVVANMERVMAATTMPTVLLGGDPDSSQDEVFASWQAALALPGVQGLTVGRTLLYPADGDVSGAVATAAYRIFQEILNNVARHANATAVEMHVTATTEALIIKVRDNGCGVTLQQLRQSKSHGVLGMSERARHFGGRVEIGPAASGGTRVRVWLPLHPERRT